MRKPMWSVGVGFATAKSSRTRNIISPSKASIKVKVEKLSPLIFSVTIVFAILKAIFHLKATNTLYNYPFSADFA